MQEQFEIVDTPVEASGATDEANQGRDTGQSCLFHGSGRTLGRLRLAFIDRCLNGLEERHLQGGYIGRQSGCRSLVEALVSQTSLTPPDPVWEARTSFALHAALLDWESNLMDDLIPMRRQLFPDLEQDCENWPIFRPRRARIRGRGRRGRDPEVAGAA